MFVFDKRSSWYYEPKSDFFYDANSSLYYGNKLKTYFKYDPMYDPPFVALYCRETSESQPTPADSDLSNVSDKSKNQSILPKIEVNLTTKRLAATSETKLSSHAVEQPVEAASAVQSLPSGNPVCSLCMRKFKTLEQLLRHERFSDLHKANMRKKQAEEYIIKARKSNNPHPQQRKPILSEFELLQPPQKPSWMDTPK